MQRVELKLYNKKWKKGNQKNTKTMPPCNLQKILKTHRNMLCIHHYLIPVKILKIYHSMLCIHHPHTCGICILHPMQSHLPMIVIKIHNFVVNHHPLPTQTRVIGLLYPILSPLAMKLNHQSVQIVFNQMSENKILVEKKLLQHSQ